jgi:cyclohexanecarboxylate-CoA ligase
MWDTLVPAGPSLSAEYYRQGWWRAETFLDDLWRHARDRPDAAAVIGYQDGAHASTLTYQQLAQSVERFAGALTELGVSRGDVVVVHLPNWWMLSPLYLACARVGAVVASVIPPFGGRELSHILRVTRARVCVVPDTFNGTDYAGRLQEMAPDTLAHRVVVGDAAATGAIDFAEFFVGAAWEQRHPVVGITPPGPEAVAQVVYTSGTTGQPKGVAHSFNTLHVAGRAFSDVYELGADDVVLIPHFLAHLAGSAYSIWMSVALGGTCVMQDSMDMGLLLDLVAAHGVSMVFCAPFYVMGMIAAQRERPRDLSSLRCLNTGSAPVPPQLAAQVGEILGLRLDSNWGMSEVGAVTITRRTDPDGWAAHSDGSPVDWMQVRIQARPDEQVGRLLVRGAALCLGYLKQRDAFLACLDGDGWFDTGDTARPDGRGGIRITGRRADLIIRANNMMVPTLEIETLLAGHPAVADVLLIGYQDPQVPGADLVCAVVVPDGAPPDLGDLRGFLDELHVTSRDWPDRIEVVAELPRNAQGKVLRSALRQQLEQREQR